MPKFIQLKPAKKVDNGNRKVGSEEKRINKETYSLPRHCVKRVSLGNEEYIQINIKEAKIFKGQQECDVFFKLVDGTGKNTRKNFWNYLMKRIKIKIW